ncbi:hypothetical protein [Hyphomicrobium sp. MC8b]|uniref:hypothetical protein n=1 Tax=Hyphomicrobium sp. MC8b TaxID=300273 RepID=UPI0039191731
MSENRQLQDAVQRALAVSRKSEVAKQLDGMRKELAAAKEERRVMRFACAVTGRKFAVVYKRGAAEERFRIAAVETDAARGQDAGSQGACAQQAYQSGDFDHSGWRCPYCSVDSWVVKCRCGDNICTGRTIKLAGGAEYFRCHDCCGEAAYLVDAKQVWAEAPGRGVKALKAPPAGPALPKPGQRR